jgi:sugar lactone lactonase YvrE
MLWSLCRHQFQLLYVADSGNNRIQFFPFEQQNETRIVESGSAESFSLNWPTEIVLDADGNLFIVDQDSLVFNV